MHYRTQIYRHIQDNSRVSLCVKIYHNPNNRSESCKKAAKKHLSRKLYTYTKNLYILDNIHS